MIFGRTPPVTRILLWINLGVHILVHLLASDEAAGNLLGFLGLTPAAFWQGAAWQPVTSLFLHANGLHILGNMIGLWSLGSMLERGIGSSRYLWLYMVSGLTGALFVVLADPGSIRVTIGASGAVLGLLGAVAVLNPEARMLFFIFPMRARTAALIIGVASVLFQSTGGLDIISHLGHLGGLVGGYLYTRFALVGNHKAQSQAGGFADGYGGFGTNPFGGSRPGGPFGGGPGGGASPFGSGPGGPGGNAQQQQVLRMMEAMLRNAAESGRQGNAGWNQPGQSGSGGGEKVINPRPPGASASEDSASSPPPQQSQGAAGPGMNRMVVFDPVTGRFVVRDL